jgi:hypothetical protein
MLSYGGQFVSLPAAGPPRRRSHNLRENLRLLRSLCAGALALTFTPPLVLPVEND